MNMYITDTSWLLLNMPEPNKYKRIRQLGEINEYKFINYQRNKQEYQSKIDNIKYVMKGINGIDDIETYINDFKTTIDQTNTYSENYLLNHNNYYYVGNIIDNFV